MRGPGEQGTLTVYRDGRSETFAVPLIVAPEDPPRDIRTLAGRHPFGGAEVANLSPAFAEEVGLDPMDTGVVVLNVNGGPARRLGLRPGDIVLEINDAHIDTTATLADVLDEAASEWEITIRRNGERMRVTVRA